jgi:hypothetical protein
LGQARASAQAGRAIKPPLVWVCYEEWRYIGLNLW